MNTTFRLLCLGLVAALIVLLIGVTADYLHITGAFEIIWAAILAISGLTAAIVRRVIPKSVSRTSQNRSS